MDWLFISKVTLEILKYTPVTLKLTLGALIFATPISLLFAFAEIKKIPGLKQIARICLSILRGSPTILQLFIFYSIVPKFLASIVNTFNLNWDVYAINNEWYAYITLGITIVTYLTEALRSSIEGIGKGQYEAGVMVGMTEWQVYKRIILPQALVIAMPMLGNVLVKLVKYTSLAFALSVVEVTGATKILSAKNLKYFESYIALMIVYLIIIGGIEILLAIGEKKFSTYKLKKQ